jgi:hypothetical protein
MATRIMFEPDSSQLSLVEGERQPTSEALLVVEPASPFAPEARKGRLYLVIEPATAVAHPAPAYQLVARTVRKTFYEDPSSSVTSALRTALRAANKALYEYNVAQSLRNRATFGLSCAVIKGDDFYLAQVAPSQAYLATQGRLRAFPNPVSWGTTRSGAAMLPGKPLGTSLFVEPELYRSTLGLGDCILLGSSSLNPLLDRTVAQELLAEHDPATVLDQLAVYAEAAGLKSMQSLAICCISQQERNARQPSSGRNGPRAWSQALGRSATDWFEQIRASAGGSLRGRRPPTRRRNENEAPTAPPPAPTYSVNPPPRPLPIDLGESMEQRYSREQSEQASSRQGLVGEQLSSYLGEGGYMPPPRPQRRIDLGDGPSLAAKAQPYKMRYEIRPAEDLSLMERLALPFQRARFRFNDATRRRLIRRREPVRPSRPQVSGLSYRKPKPNTPWLLFLALSLIVTLLIWYGTTLSRQNATDRVIDYFTIAEQRMIEVREAPDEASALERLEIARQAIEEVRVSPNVTTTNTTLWLRYQDLVREYERDLATVQRLTYFNDVELIATHPLPTGSFASVSVPPATSSVTDPLVIENLRYIYALDDAEENARLYRILRDGGVALPYLSPNDAVQTTVVGSLRSQTWRTDQVVAVDRGPGGFGYYFRRGDSWNYTKLGDSEIWSGRDYLDVETYDGNLYIWGAEPGEILKYNSGFYGDSPIFWIDATSLESQDLSTVVDMAVDGNIYLLRSDGTVLVFNGGKLLSELRPDQITPPIAAVRRMFVTGTPEEGSIFMVDPQNERVIQLDKITGKVVQQIRVRTDSPYQLDKLANLWVDASGSRPILYLVNSDRILRAALPAPPQPFRRSETTPTSNP